MYFLYFYRQIAAGIEAISTSKSLLGTTLVLLLASYCSDVPVGLLQSRKLAYRVISNFRVNMEFSSNQSFILSLHSFLRLTSEYYQTLPVLIKFNSCCAVTVRDHICDWSSCCCYHFLTHPRRTVGVINICVILLCYGRLGQKDNPDGFNDQTMLG